MPLRPLLALLGLAATWGASYLLIAVALESTTAAALTLGRFVPAAVLVALLARRQLAALRGRWRAVLLLALVQQAAPMLLIALGERDVPSGLAGTLVACTPLWGALLAPVLGRPAPSAVGWLGLLTGIVGVGLLLGAGTAGRDGLLGAGMILLAAAGYAVGAAWTAQGFRDVPRLALLAGVLTASSLLLVPPLLLDLPDRLPTAEGVVAVALLGLVGTGLAFIAFYWMVDQVGPERTVLVTYLAPVFAVGYGVVLRDERLTVAGLVGMVLVLAGAYLAGRRPRRAAPAVPAPSEVVAAR